MERDQIPIAQSPGSLFCGGPPFFCNLGHGRALIRDARDRPVRALSLLERWALSGGSDPNSHRLKLTESEYSHMPPAAILSNLALAFLYI